MTQMKASFIILTLIGLLGLHPIERPTLAQSDAGSFTSPKESFSVRAVCHFREISKEKTWSIVGCRSGDNWFFVTSTTVEETSHLEAIRLTSASEIKSLRVPAGNSDGLKYSFADHDGNFQNVVTVKVPERFYIFHSVSPSSEDPTVLAFVNSVAVNRFISITRQNETNSKTILERLKKPSPDPKYMSRERAFLTDPAKFSQTFEAKPGQTSPFRLLSTIQPAYTSLASLYGIEGAVQIRATFLPSGYVGSATAVNRLPMGLTANALAAAKFIRFEPKVENGVAQTITKTIEYYFSIF